MIEVFNNTHTRHASWCAALVWILLGMFWTLPAAAQCTDTIVPDSLSAAETGAPVSFCVEFDYRVALRSERTLDGSRLGGFAEGCDYDTLVYYPYSTFPYRGVAGPYRLLEWVVGARTFSGTFVDIADLVSQMNTLDPGGNWTNDDFTANLVGGVAGVRYGRMRVQHIGDGTTRNVTANYQSIANGTLVSASGAGWHSYSVFDPNSGCRDTLALLLRPTLPDIRLDVTLQAGQTSPVQCLDISGLIGTAQDPTLCGGPTNGSVNQTSAYCYSYTPSPGFSGSDLVCFSVCDDTNFGGAPICQLVYINFTTQAAPVVNRDTLAVTIKSADTTVCVNALLDFDGLPETVALCSGQPGGVVFVPNLDGCIDLGPVAGFAGRREACVVYCQGSICDTTILQITVRAACAFDPFSIASESIPSTGIPTNYCLPVAPGVLASLELSVNGVRYAGPQVPCDDEVSRVYNYAPLFGNGSAGPYTLLSWIVDGQDFSTSFADPAALTAYMQSVDPTGGWVLDAARFEIAGGDDAINYGTMRIVHNASGTRTDLLPNLIDEAQGTAIALPGEGNYRLRLRDPNTGCTDELLLTVGAGTPPGSFSERVVPLDENMNSGRICLFPTLRDAFVACGDTRNGTATFDAQGCVSYQPNAGFIGQDTFCRITCTLPDGPCDTVRLIFNVTRPTLPTVTVDVISYGDSPFEACGTPAFAGPYVATTCGITGPYSATPRAGACVSIDPTDGSSADGEVCVRFCAQADTSRCQNFLFRISKTAACAPDVIPADSLVIPAQPGVLSICLGDGIDLRGFTIGVNGQPAVTREDPSCGVNVGGGGGGMREVYIYSTFLTPSGPKRIDGWDIGGTLISGVTAADYAALADSMNLADPSNDWTFDPVLEGIVAGTSIGTYSPLILFDPTTGSTVIIRLEIMEIPDSTGGGGTFVPSPVLDLPNPGRYEVTLMRTDSSCADRLLIIREAEGNPQVDTLEFLVPVDAVAGPFCVDLSELSGPPASNASCGFPQNGTLAFTSLECFTYEPNAGYRGLDSACVIVCTAGGLQCDTTFIRFVVTESIICDPIFVENQASSTTEVCDAPSTVCLPVLPDEAFFYTLTIDGAPAPNALACGADTVTVYSYADVAGRGNAGPYRVEGYRLPSGVFNANVANADRLVDSLNRWDPNGNWRLNPLDFTIRGGVNGYSYDTLVLRQIATDTLNRLVPVEILFENQLSVELTPGTYSIGITDTRTACTDVLTYTLSCLPTEACTQITTESPLALTLTDCAGTVAFIVCNGTADPDQFVAYVNDVEVPAVVNGTTLMIQLPEGATQVRIVDPALACSSAFEVVVTCRCPGPLPEDAYGRSIDCESPVFEVCLPTSSAALTGYNILVDGLPYTGPLTDCAEEDAFVIEVASLGVGPYTVDSFRIDNEVFKADVTTLAALADSLSVWDVRANWRYDAARGMIIGGSTRAVYGDLAIREITSGVSNRLLVSQEGMSSGVALVLRRGAMTRTLSFERDGECTQEVVITLSCGDSEIVLDTLEIGGAKQYCVDTTDLTGPVVTLRDVCAEADTIVALDFDARAGCVNVRAIALGERTACLVACDASGVCDTTFYTITVIEKAGAGGLDAVDDEFRIRLDERLLRSLTGNDTFLGALRSIRIVEGPTQGIATLSAAGLLSYEPTAGACGFVDTLTYEICQGVLCDRAEVIIRVRCELVEAYTGFSPNGDGVNDRFVIEGIEDFPDNTLRIYNRWGNEVYVVSGYANDWEGTWLETPLTDGTYFWLLEIAGEEPINGWVQINR